MIPHDVNLFDLHKRHIQILENIFAKIKCIYQSAGHLFEIPGKTLLNCTQYISQQIIVGTNSEVSKFRTITGNPAGPSVGDPGPSGKRREGSLFVQKSNLKGTCRVLAPFMQCNTEVEARGMALLVELS